MARRSEFGLPFLLPIAGILALSTAACGSSSNEGPPDGGPVADAGKVADAGSIADAGPSPDGGMLVTAQNSTRWAVTKFPTPSGSNRGSYNLIVWLPPVDGGFFYCVVDPYETTAEAAQASTASADRTSPSTGGCAGEPWVKMTAAGDAPDAGPQIPVGIQVMGAWADNYASDGLLDDEDIAIDETLWSEDTVLQYDNATRTAITQTYASSQYDPDLFNKVVWTAPQNGDFWYCEVVYGLATAAAAEQSTAEPDSTDPATGGCPVADGGFPWTEMMPLPPIEIVGVWENSASGSSVMISSVYWGANSIVWYGDAIAYATSSDGGT